jgi:thioredoxin 1
VEVQYSQYSGTVIVDFWATWFVPCKRMSPIFDKMAEKYTDVKFAKLDADANISIPAQYGIQSIPTTMVFKNGKPVAQMVGFKGESGLVNFIEKSLQN